MLKRKTGAQNRQQTAQEVAVPDDEPVVPRGEADIERAFAQCFASPEGQRVLNHLKQRYLYTPDDPDISPARLRHAQGQRDAVLTILRLIERGRAET